MGKHRKFFKDESGIAAVEYALMLALIGMVIIASMTIIMGRN
ncbi:MAG: Flp family type IVb pilin [Desulfobaccales bacterium]